MTTLQQITAGTGADVMVNENFQEVSPAALFAWDPVTTTGLTWGFKGGQYNGNTIADGTLTLTASQTNYVVANRATGTVSASTSSTNWNDSTNYLRLYSVVAGASTFSSWTDYRQIIGMSATSTASVTDFAQNVPGTTGLTYAYNGGQIRQTNTVTQVGAGTLTMTANATNYVEVSATGNVSSNTSGFTYGRCPMAAVTANASAITAVVDRRAPFTLHDVYLNAQNTFGKAQTVAPTANASVSGTYTPDASSSNNFELTLTGNTTIANPTNLTHGQVLNFCIDQDATGGRTLAFGTLYKWPNGAQPGWPAAASAKSFFSAYYDGTILRCSGGVAFA